MVTTVDRVDHARLVRSTLVLSDYIAIMSSRMRITGLLALAVALLVTGVVLWIADMQTEFGWFAYAPLDQQSASGIVLITGRRQASLLMSLIGLVLLSGLVGFAVGRRSKPA